MKKIIISFVLIITLISISGCVEKTCGTTPCHQKAEKIFKI